MTAVTLLFRSRWSSSLPHLVNSVSLFLDSSMELPLHRACRFGSFRLLDRIWNSSQVFVDDPGRAKDQIWTLQKYIPTDRHYRAYQFNLCLLEAIKLKNLEMVKWISRRFQGCLVSKNVVARAVDLGLMAILMFFRDVDTGTDAPWYTPGNSRTPGVGHRIEWQWASKCAASNRRSDIVWWLHRYVRYSQHDMSEALTKAVANGDITLATMRWTELLLQATSTS